MARAGFLCAFPFTVDFDPDAHGWGTGDDALTDDAVRVLGAETVHAAFVCLGAVDIVGHEIGTGPEYRAAVEVADRRIGRIIAAIEARRSAPESTCWIAACGPQVPAWPRSVSHADVHPHVLDTLGMPVDPAWGLDGRPFGTVYNRV